MSLGGRIHGGFVFPRRIRVLRDRLTPLISEGARILDLGCGDGTLAWSIQQVRNDVSVRGIDILVREPARIPVETFDGQTVPYPDGAFDTVLIVDVLHHAREPIELLREAARVSKSDILIKDHLADAWLAVPRLRFMDWFGNARHGVALTYRYWPRQAWTEAFRSLHLTVADWNERLGLYPAPASWVFEGSLHFIARLRRD